MGLDHWIIRNIDIDSQYEFSGTKVEEIKITKKGKEYKLPTKNVSKVEYALITWRKSNHIHKWFIDNVQNGNDDCNSYLFSENKLEEFLEVLKKVDNIHKSILSDELENPTGKVYNDIKQGYKEELEKTLPTESGFFFGSTDYDEYYFESILEAIEVIEEELKFVKENKNLNIDYEYNSSW